MSLYFVDTHYYCCYLSVYVIYVYKIILTQIHLSLLLCQVELRMTMIYLHDRDDVHILVSHYFPHK